MGNSLFSQQISQGLDQIGQALASATSSAAQKIFNLPTTVLSTLVTWQKRYEARRHLAALDDRLLDDMGMTRTDAVREAKKPVWHS